MDKKEYTHKEVSEVFLKLYKELKEREDLKDKVANNLEDFFTQIPFRLKLDKYWNNEPEEILLHAMSVYYNVFKENTIEDFKTLLDKLDNVYELKNKDYGDSAKLTYENWGTLSLRIRLSDKIYRILNIMNTKEQWVEDESIIDSAEDFINYCIIYFMYLVEDGLVDIEELFEEE